MIDTIRLKIGLTNDNIKGIKGNSPILYQKIDIQNSQILYKNIKDEIKLGSYIDFVALFIDSFNNLFVELSIPKFYNSQNIYLISNNKIISFLTLLKEDLELYFNSEIIDIEMWELQRIDICYAWRFDSQTDLDDIIEVLRPFAIQRKRNYQYKSSFMSVGENYSIKFYDKNKEYISHDFKRIYKQNKDLAFMYDEISKNVLRFEVTLRKEYLKQMNYDINTFTDEYFVLNLLDYFLKKFVGVNNLKVMDKKEVLYQLMNYYSNKKAIRLWQFYRDFSDPSLKILLSSLYNRSTISRNLSELRSSSVGLLSDTLSFDLSIPSDRCVNLWDYHDSLSGESQLSVPPLSFDLPLPDSYEWDDRR